MHQLLSTMPGLVSVPARLLGYQLGVLYLNCYPHQSHLEPAFLGNTSYLHASYMENQLQIFTL